MILGAQGRKLIQAFELCKLTAYRDGGGVWTIGWGHTGPEVHEGMTITQERADELFEIDVARTVAGVNRLLTTEVTQNQFDALVSFAYNVGLDEDHDGRAEGLGDSTLLRAVNNREFIRAAIEFPKWNHDNGVVVKGLTRRRMAEQELFTRV